MRLYNFNLTMALYVFNMLESRSKNFNWRKQRPKKERLNHRKYNTTKWITSTQTVNMYRIKLVKH